MKRLRRGFIWLKIKVHKGKAEYIDQGRQKKGSWKNI